MDTLSALVYVSSSTHELSAEDLDALLADARARNQASGITGLLLHSQGNFIQYIEGPPAALAALYARIERDTRHHHLIKLFESPIERREFADWSMAFSTSTAPEFLALRRASWSAVDPATPMPLGHKMLLEFWTACRR